jgi:hypothetical protein
MDVIYHLVVYLHKIQNVRLNAIGFKSLFVHYKSIIHFRNVLWISFLFFSALELQLI